MMASLCGIRKMASDISSALGDADNCLHIAGQLIDLEVKEIEGSTAQSVVFSLESIGKLKELIEGARAAITRVTAYG